MKFIEFDDRSQYHIKKELLYSEAEILKIIQHYRNYKHLRKQTFDLKNAITKKVKEINYLIGEFESFLPKQKLAKLDKIHDDKLTKEVESLRSRIDALNNVK